MSRGHVQEQLRRYWAGRAARAPGDKVKEWEQDHLRVAGWSGGGS